MNEQTAATAIVLIALASMIAATVLALAPLLWQLRLLEL